MMKSNEPNSNLRNLTPAIRINIWRHGVNVYARDESLVPYINKIREKEKDYGIPSFSISEPITPNSGEYGVIVDKGDLSKIIWLADEGIAKILVKDEDVETIAKEVAYKSLSLTERMRQLEGVLISNGTAVISPEGRGVILFGKRAHGKTNISLVLCRDYGYSFVASDQVIFGFDHKEGDENLWLFGGTKYVTLRRSAAERYFPEYINMFPDGRFWDDRINIREEDLGIKLSREAVPINTAFLVNLDYNEDIPIDVKKDVKNDLETSLFLAEITSRHITGICSPLLNKNDSFLSLCPSFDDSNTRKKRQKIIKKVIEIPIHKTSGGKITELTDYIDKIVAYGKEIC